MKQVKLLGLSKLQLTKLESDPFITTNSTANFSEAAIQAWAGSHNLTANLDRPLYDLNTELVSAAYYCAGMETQDSRDARQRLQILVGIDADLQKSGCWGMAVALITGSFCDSILKSEVGAIPDSLATELKKWSPDAPTELPSEIINLERKYAGRLFAWIEDNLDYVYVHREERCVMIDVEARDSGVPTDRYRLSTPWGPGSGPHKPIAPRIAR